MTEYRLYGLPNPEYFETREIVIYPGDDVKICVEIPTEGQYLYNFSISYNPLYVGKSAAGGNLIHTPFTDLDNISINFNKGECITIYPLNKSLKEDYWLLDCYNEKLEFDELLTEFLGKSTVSMVFNYDQLSHRRGSFSICYSVGYTTDETLKNIGHNIVCYNDIRYFSGGILDL